MGELAGEGSVAVAAGISYRGQKKNLFILLWNMVGGRGGYQAYQQLCCVWLKFVMSLFTWF